MTKRSVKPLMFAMSMLVLLSAMPGFAAPLPSKTASNQSIESRQADLALVQSVTGNDEVAAALSVQGFTKEEINSRLASLSNDDLRSLAQNLEQVQAAGLTRSQWTWIGIGALAALILVVAVG
ncbi:MAG TPA: PA2779 family protein [Thermoanaerobaculia bacterium]|nr:PA2779 family protein [Thermoanaerobaculia bacterium]